MKKFLTDDEISANSRELDISAENMIKLVKDSEAKRLIKSFKEDTAIFAPQSLTNTNGSKGWHIS